MGSVTLGLVALESPELFVDPLILGAAVVLAVGVVGTVLADRFRIPSLLLFLGLGMAIADDGLNWIPFDDPGWRRTSASSPSW